MKDQASPQSRILSTGRSIARNLPWVLLVLVPPLFSQEERSNDGPRPAETASVESGPLHPGVVSQRVYLDPATGRLLAEPPPGTPVLRLTERELQWLSTSHEGLVERARPGGGYWLDLQGRFRHLAVAVIEPDGQVGIREAFGDAFGPSEPASEESGPASTSPESTPAGESQPEGQE